MRTTVCLLPFLALLLLGACDNFARGFDPGFNGGGGSAQPSTVELVPVGGDVRDGRPKVRNTWPKGGGWPTTVPVVVEFTESVSSASIAPTSPSGTDGRLILRIKGTEQALPCLYDFVLGNRAVILRPSTGLSNVSGQAYEVVLLPESRDVDGIRFQVSTETILAEFQVDQEAAVEDGQIVAVLPRDNQTDATRESDLLVVFDKPAETASVTASSLQVVPGGGAALAGNISAPLRIANQPDPRVFRFRPTGGFAGSTQFQLLVDDTILFGQNGGKLDFRGRTPFARFTTIGPAAPTAVRVGNPLAGFDDKINRGNVANLVLHVDVPASASAGDQLLARIYGFDNGTQPADDIKYVERTAPLVQSGAHTATVDFGTALGSVGAPQLGEGAVVFAVQLRRGDAHTGFAHGDEDAGARFDLTPPTLVAIGPPGVSGSNDALTDQEVIALFGSASEAIGDATLTDGVSTVGLYAGADDGRFLLKPLALGRRTAPLAYTLNLTDSAGNMAVAAFTGNIVQRGVVTGTNTGTLTVELYDETTLLPVVGAAVLVEPGTPALPGSGQLLLTTGADGRATFAIAGPTTITAVAQGYHLRTLYGTSASHASLPLRPQQNATASFAGTAAFQATANMTALVGNNAFADPLLLSVQTAAANPTAIPSTPILPGRPQVVTAFAGVYEPTAVPTFTTFACQMAGPTLTTPTPPAAPAAPGGSSNQTLALAGTGPGIANLATIYTKDFNAATGLDTTTLTGGKPFVRVTGSLLGFGNQTLMGVGFTTPAAAGMFTVNGSYALGAFLALADFGPVAWVATEARDAAGAVSRHRVLLVPANGTFIDLLQPPAIPTIVAPGGPSTGSPSVTFADRLDRATLPAGLAFGELQAQDGAGRQWSLWFEDNDGTGSDTVQFPDLMPMALVGLAPGTWSIRATGRLYLSTTFGPGDIVLAERQRQEVTFARSPAVDFIVQ